MDNELTFNNKKFLSSKRAGELAGYTNDYIARLCRQGKVDGQMVGRAWYVDEESFQNFVDTNALQKERRSIQLSKERKKEYVSSPKKKKILPVVVEKQDDNNKSSVFLTLHREIFLKRVGVFVVFVFLMFGVYNIFLGQRFTTEQAINDRNIIIVNDNAASVLDSITEFFGTVWQFATGAFRSLAVRDITSNNARDQQFTEGSTPLAQTDRERDGMVVVPSSGIDEDEARKQKIEDAFSDEIQIVPSPDGRSGIIKPVFKRQEDQEYLYVLVPVDEKGAQTTE